MYDRWTLEEISVMLKKMTEFNMNKGCEKLDEYMSAMLLDQADEYREKIYVAKNFV